MLPQCLQPLIAEFGIADHPEPFDYITDLPALECPSCCAGDEIGMKPIQAKGVFGLERLRCFATVTGPYIRGDKPIPAYDGIPYCYTHAADWSISVNADDQTVISQRPPDDLGKSIYQHGASPAYVAALLREFDVADLNLEHPHFTRSAAV